MRFLFIILTMVFLVIEKTHTKDDIKCSEAPPDACGSNATCYDVDKRRDPHEYSFYFGSAFCKCDHGFIGTPPNCKKGCKYDHNCNDGKFCDDSTDKCRKGCREYNCPKNNYCNLSTRKCTEGCLKHSDCSDGQYCDFATSKCIPGCIYDHQCEEDEHCSKNSKKCRKVCRGYSCGPNSKCLMKNDRKICSCKTGFAPQKGIGCQKEDFAKASCDNACGDRSYCKIVNENETSCSCKDFQYTKNPFIECEIEKPTAPATYLPPTTFKPTSDSGIIGLCTVMACSG